MDSILALLVVLWIFGSLVKASKGKSAAKKQSVHRTVRPEETPPPAPPSGRAVAAADRKKKPAASRAQAPAVSAEGRDTCDPSLGHERRSVEPADDAYALDEGLVPELDAQTLIQGIVMSEILKRPYERKWGRR